MPHLSVCTLAQHSEENTSVPGSTNSVRFICRNQDRFINNWLNTAQECGLRNRNSAKYLFNVRKEHAYGEVPPVTVADSTCCNDKLHREALW